MENRPRGGGADGEGGGGYGSPLSCLDVSLKTSLAGSPPTARPLPRPPPAPFIGGRGVSHREPGEVMHTPGTVSIGNQPPWGGGAYFAAGVETSPPPLSPLPSMPSRKKPHHAAVTRGIPHEDGGSIFIQIPVTPRDLSMD